MQWVTLSCHTYLFVLILCLVISKQSWNAFFYNLQMYSEYNLLLLHGNFILILMRLLLTWKIDVSCKSSFVFFIIYTLLCIVYCYKYLHCVCVCLQIFMCFSRLTTSLGHYCPFISTLHVGTNWLGCHSLCYLLFGATVSICSFVLLSWFIQFVASSLMQTILLAKRGTFIYSTNIRAVEWSFVKQDL